MKPVAPRSPRAAAVSVLILTGLALIVIGVAHAGDRGWWSATEFQVVNLDPTPAYITARFTDMSGATVYTLTDTIPPLGTRFYQPELLEPPLPADFAGTLSVDSLHNVAATILHRDNVSGTLLLPIQGNTTFEVLDEGLLGDVAHIPVDLCTIVIIHNPGEVEASGSLDILNLDGSLALDQPFDLLPDTSSSYSMVTLLPSLLSGGAVIGADHPVEVTVIHNCLGEGTGSYVAPAAASHVWVAPQVLGGGIGQSGSTVAVKNASGSLATVTLLGPSGPIGPPSLLLPQGSLHTSIPTGIDGPVWISSTQLATARIVTRYTGLNKAQQPAGLYTYGAFDPAHATNHVALPMLLDGYDGWSTSGGLYIQNVGAVSTTVTLRYVTDDGRVFVEMRLAVEPGEVWQPSPPAQPFLHAAATAHAEQPIVALVTAQKQGAPDGWLAYRGINYVPRKLFLLYLPVIVRGWE